MGTSTSQKRRAMTTENARRVKLAGHLVEKEFAELVDGQIYPGTKKKDVIDQQGNIHSVKSGDKKSQVFLYSRQRFSKSIGFLGALHFINCIDVFPALREEYEKDKEKYKNALKAPMENLKNFLASNTAEVFIHSNKQIFFLEALFHSSEVDYLTIKDMGAFHIFDATETINVLDENTILDNSRATRKGEYDFQKVLFKDAESNTTLGEIEMRNEGAKHYKQIKFWVDKKKITNLLIRKISPCKQVSGKIVVYGKAIGKFKWPSTKQAGI